MIIPTAFDRVAKARHQAAKAAVAAVVTTTIAETRSSEQIALFFDDEQAPQPLGYSDGVYYYMSSVTQTIDGLTADQHASSARLQSLAPLDWWRNFAFLNADGDCGRTVDWATARDAIMSRAAVITYDPRSMTRGLGVWPVDLPDDPECVALVNVGDKIGRITRDGQPVVFDMSPADAFRRTGLAFTREATALTVPGAVLTVDPLSSEEARRWVNYLSAFRWTTPDLSARLLAGWLVSGAICGYSQYRPHLWINGASGSGKTTAYNAAIVPIISRLGFVFNGETTEPGMRHKLKVSSLPCCFDEAEGDQESAARRVTAILTAARSMSRPSEAVLAKGSAHGGTSTYAQSGQIMLSSVNNQLVGEANLNRFTVLEMHNHPMTEAEMTENLRTLDAAIDFFDQAKTLPWVMSWWQRVLSFVPHWRETVKLTTRVMRDTIRDLPSRVHEHYATLIVGYYVMSARHLDAVPAEGTLREIISQMMSQGLGGIARGETTGAAEQETDGDAALSILKNVRLPVTIMGEAGARHDNPPLARVAFVGWHDPDNKNSTAADAMENEGMYFIKRRDGTRTPTLVIPNKSARVSEAFAKAGRWIYWGKILRQNQLITATSVNQGIHYHGKGIAIPLDLLSGGDVETVAESDADADADVVDDDYEQMASDVDPDLQDMLDKGEYGETQN